MMRVVFARATAVAALALLALVCWYYPASKLLLGAGLGAYIALLLWRPSWWLAIVPALLPVLDFAPWTGWYFVDELDLLLLATCVGGYLRYGKEQPTRLPGLAKAACVLLVLCWLGAAARGLLPLPAWDANALSNYVSPYNSLRVLKGLLWPLLLLPLLRQSAGPQAVNIESLFVPGMLGGLVLTSLAVMWERDTFPGLLNFASDYRPTAPFSAMHTGGAALDAYLAMAFPFVALWLIDGRHHPARLAAGLVCLMLGCFAGLTIFSRDIYIAYAASGALIGALICAHRVRRGALRWQQLAAALLMGVLLVWMLSHVFSTSGYRGLLASLGLLAAAVVVGGAEARLRHGLLAAGVAVALLAANGALELLGGGGETSKTAYAGYILACAVCAAGAGLLLFGREQQRLQGMALAAGALPAIGLAAVLVGKHWGGAETLPDLAMVLLLAAALAACRLLPQPPWRLNRVTLTVGFFATIVLAILIPITGSYYTGSRFSTVGDDLGVRLDHWHEALDMMDKDGVTQAFGQGLGRYPQLYMWRNTHGETPGSFRYVEEGSNRYLRLGGSELSTGYGEILRFLQRVDVQPGRRYVLSLDYRTSSDKAGLSTAVCERWLLYPQSCLIPRIPGVKWTPEWVHVEQPLPPRTSTDGLIGTPMQLEIAVWSRTGTMDVDNVSLREVDTGRELIRNGSFSDANDYWFFSSDRNHMPWHVKNYAVNTVFELGWVGALATAFFLLAVGAPLVGRGLGGDLQAAVFLAAMTGCMMVGLFDSITDVPRLTILFMLLALAGNLQAVAQKRKRRRRSSEDQAADALIA